MVDNASSDDSLERLRDYFKDKVTFIASRENNGFAAGNNQALKIAQGKICPSFKFRHNCLGKYFRKYLQLYGK